jgi:probable HAF family extracellular repeat protein
MARVPLIGGAYTARTLGVAAQRCVNLYQEPLPQAEGEQALVAHFPTPGLRQLTAVGTGPIRGLRQATNGAVYVVSGNQVYSVDTSWNATLRGSITAGATTPVSMSDNTLDLVIVDGSPSGWTVNLASNAFAAINDPTGAFAGANRVEYLDTFLIFNKPGTPQFYWSGSLATTFDSLDFANKSSWSDLLQTLIVAKREIWLLGERTTEIWYDSGASDIGQGSSQFQQVQSVFVDHGCVAKYSAAQYDNAIFWLTQDRAGRGIVLQGSGYQTKRVSTYAIETEIAGYERLDDAIGMTYQLGGHTFYVLTFPRADKTWCYDVTTGFWHEWVWLDTNGEEHRHRANCMYPINGEVIVGDHQNGNLYALDLDTYTDAGRPIKRLRTWPHMLQDGHRVFYRQFLANFESGEAPNETGTVSISAASWPGGYTALPGLTSGTGTWAYGVSGDGLVVVGEADDASNNAHAVYWTQSSGPVDLGSMPGFSGGQWANAASADGSVIVGVAGSDDLTTQHAFRWTSGGMVDLGTLPGQAGSRAFGVSADGAVVVGFGFNPATNHKAVRWTAATGLQDLGLLAGGTAAEANAVSADGSVIVGWSDATDTNTHPVYWSGGVAHDLGFQLGGHYGVAYAVSADGSVIVGEGDDSTNTPRAFRWTSGGGMVDLGLLPGGSWAYATGVSADGSVVVGLGNDAAGRQVAWQWTAADGMEALPDIPGLEPGGQAYAGGIAGNATAIVGYSSVSTPTGGNGQHPAHFVASVDAPVTELASRAVFPSALSTGVWSCWLHDSSNQAFQMSLNENALNPASYYHLGIGLDRFNTFNLSVDHQNSPGTTIQFQSHASGTWPGDCPVHVLVSFDLTNASQRLQVYINDVAWTPTIGPMDNQPLPTFGSLTNTFVQFGNAAVPLSGFVADHWFGSTASFVDLTVTANRRKFINADLSPVDLGANGQNPFGTAPQIYQHMAANGPTSDWLTNKGSIGGTFAVTSGSVAADGDPCETTTTLPTAWVYPHSGSGPTPPPVVILPEKNLITLRWSDDRGHTYGQPVLQNIGDRGEYDTFCNWQRLGYARDRIFELSWSVPMRCSLMGAWIDLQPAGS